MILFIDPPLQPKEIDPNQTILAVGFGTVSVFDHEGNGIWSGDDTEKLLANFEPLQNGATVEFLAPLHDETYTKTNGKWILTHEGRGFA